MPHRGTARDFAYPPHEPVVGHDSVRARPVQPPPLPHLRTPMRTPISPNAHGGADPADSTPQPPPTLSVGERRAKRPQRREQTRAAPSENRRSGWLWGLAGFLLGMVFWHLIGFWGFVNAVLLTPGSRERPVIERPQSSDLRVTPGSAPVVRAVGPVRSTAKPGSAAAAQAAAANAPPVGSASWGAVVLPSATAEGPTQ